MTLNTTKYISKYFLCNYNWHGKDQNNTAKK